MGPIFVYGVIVFSCLAGLFRPFWGLCGYLFLVYLQPEWNWRFDGLIGLQYQKNIMVCVLLGTLFHFSIENHLRWGWSFVLIGLLFLGWEGIATSTSLAQEVSSIYFDILWKSVLVMVLLIFFVDSPEKVIQISTAVTIGSGWNAYCLNRDYLNIGWCRWLNTSWGLKGDSNILCLFSLLPIVASTGIMFTAPSRILRFVAGISLILHVHMVFILESRGAMLGLSLAACLTFLFIPKTKLTYTIVAVTAIVIAVVAGPPVIKEFGSIFADEGERDNSAQSRLTLWRAAFTIANDYPLTGVGPGATQFFIPRYEPIYSNTTAKHPHNVFLDVLSGSGYPALLLLVVLLCIPWLRALKIIRLRDPTNLHRNYLVTIPILIGIPAFSVSGFFAGSGMIESIYYMLGIAVGGMLSYERIYQDEIHAQNTDAESDIDDEETTISERYSGLEQAESV